MSGGGRIAKRLDGISESATLRLNAQVQALKAQGADVINLTAGEPDFPVPDAAKEAVVAAVEANRSKYTPVAGLPELRTLIAEKTTSQQPGLARAWTPADVVVTNGGKQAIFNACLALLDPGDEVLIPAPYWLSYPEMARIAGGVPKIIETEADQSFRLTPDQLRDAIRSSKRPRLLFLNSPSNPTGALQSREQYRALGEVIAEEVRSAHARDLVVISDEIYDRIVFEKPFASFLAACPELQQRVITVNGMSKSAAMTGWRVGWSVASSPYTQAMSTLQGQSTSGINALAQWASIAALKLPESTFSQQVQSFRQRRDLTLEILAKAGKIKVIPPGGAFYAFAGVGAYLRPGEDSVGFAERLLNDARVAVIPGTPFGAPEWVRISFATDERSLRDGCERITSYLSR